MAKIYTVIAEAIKNSTIKNQFSTVDVVDKVELVEALSIAFAHTDALFNGDSFQETCGEEVTEDDETKVIEIEEPKITVSVYWADVPKQNLKKLAEMQTDVLAHKLDIDFETALFIQGNFRAILKEGK